MKALKELQLCRRNETDWTTALLEWIEIASSLPEYGDDVLSLNLQWKEPDTTNGKRIIMVVIKIKSVFRKWIKNKTKR